jgi:hypothetical protein
MYVSISGVTANGLTPAGRKLLRAFEARVPAGRVPSGTYLPETLQAAEVVVDAIASSNGTRASVLQRLHAIRVSGGLFGGFRFDRHGDITPAPFVILRITGGRGSPRLAPDYRGAVVDRIIRVPTRFLD